MQIGPQHGEALPSFLSDMADKRLLYAADTYFRESWEDLLEVESNPQQLLDRLATVTFKPDAFAARVVLPALKWLEQQGFTPVAAREVAFDRPTIRGIWFYQWNIATRTRKDVVDQLLGSGPSLLVALRGDAGRSASRHLSTIKGPATPTRRSPGQLRYELCSPNTLLNFVHTADEPADIVREIGVYFPAAERVELFRQIAEGGDQSAQAELMARRIEEHVPAHPLQLELVLDELERGTSGRQDEPATRLALRVAELRRGAPTDWPTLLADVRAAGLTVDPWSTNVLATSVVDMDLPAGEVLVPGISSGGQGREHG